MGVDAGTPGLVRACIALSEQVDVTARDRVTGAGAHEGNTETIHVRDVETGTINLGTAERDFDLGVGRVVGFADEDRIW